MTDRERLIELIHRMERDYKGLMCNWREIDEPMPPTFEVWAADNLLANGVIVPPCKVGDKIYYPSALNDRIFEKTVDEIMIHNNDGDIGCYVHFASNYMPFENIGKTVFLTKEEAEEKLKELQQ